MDRFPGRPHLRHPRAQEEGRRAPPPAGDAPRRQRRPRRPMRTRTCPTSSSGTAWTSGSSPSSRSRRPRPALQLRGRVPDQGEEVHPPGRRRAADHPDRPQGALGGRLRQSGIRARRQPRRPQLPGRLRHRHDDRGPQAGPQEKPLLLLHLAPTAATSSYYDDGAFLTYEFATGKSYPITKDVPANFVNEDDDHNVKNPPDYPVGWSEDGIFALLSDGWDIWKRPRSTADGAVNLTVNGRKDQIRYRGLRSARPRSTRASTWPSPLRPHVRRMDQEGRDRPPREGQAGRHGPPLGRRRIRRCRSRPDKAEVYSLHPRHLQGLLRTSMRPTRLLKNGRRITDVNPRQKDFLWSSGQMLLDYKMDPKSGKDVKLQAALFLPANYEKGKTLPDHRLLLREDVAGAQPLHHALVQRLQQVRLHQQRLRRPDARHHLQDQRPRHERGLVRPAGPRSGRGDRRRRPVQGRPARAIPGAATRPPSSSPRPTSPRPWPAPR